MNCNICLEEYNGDSKIPKILPCGHTYCLPCIILMCNNGSLLACPTCQKPLKSTQPERLNTNHALITASNGQLKVIHLKNKDKLIANGLVCKEHNEEFMYICEYNKIYCSVCIRYLPVECRRRMITERERKVIMLMRSSVLKKLYNFTKEVFDKAEALLPLTESMKYEIGAMAEKARENDERWINAMKAATDDKFEGLKQNMMSECTVAVESFKVLETDSILLKDSAMRLKGFEPDGIEQGGIISAESLERNIDRYFEMQEMVSLLKKCHKAKILLDNYQSLVFRPIAQSDVDAYRRKVLNSVKQGLYIRSGDSVLQEYKMGKEYLTYSEEISVGWDGRNVFCLQELKLYKYNFASSLWEFEILGLTLDSIEYKDLTELTIVANEKMLYIVGGFNNKIREHTASCFCACKNRICRVASLNRPKSLVTAIYTQNTIYAIGGKITRENVLSETQACTDIERYNCFTNTWELLSVHLSVPRYLAAACMSETGLLIVGGYKNANEFCGAVEVMSKDNFAVQNKKKALSLPYEPSKFGAIYKDSMIYLMCEIADSIDKHDKKGDYYVASFTLEGECEDIKKIGRIKMGSGRGIAVHEGLFYNFVVEPVENTTAKLSPVVYNTKGVLESKLEINKGAVEILLTDN